MVSETTTQVHISVWIRRIAAIVLILTYINLVIVLLQISVVPSKYLLLVLPLYGVFSAVVIWLLVDQRQLRKKVWLWTVVVIALLMSILNISGYVVTRSTDNLIGGIQSTQTGYSEYVIVARKGEDVKVDTATSVGVIQNDPLYSMLSEPLARETQAKQSSYPTLTNLTEGMRTKEVQLGSMRKASLELVKENYPDFYNSIVVLASYRVKDTSVATEQPSVSQPFVLYISGIDTYGEVATVSRSDVNMMAVINPLTHNILLVNTPRDYYVQLHDTTGVKDKLTHAGIYGVDMSRQTMQDLYGVSIPYYARVNFTSLVKIIDTIGPIAVQSDYAFKSYQVGTNTLDSKHALEFARERYSFQEGDRQRGRNQQHVLEAIIAKISKPQNAVHANEVMNVIQDSLETNMNKETVKQLIRTQLDNIKPWETQSISVDGTGSTQSTYSMGAQPLYVMIPDEQSLANAKQQIAAMLSAR